MNVVVDDEDARSHSLEHARLGRLLRVGDGGPDVWRQANAERRSGRRHAGDLDFAVEVGNDAVTNRQPQPGSHPDRLGGEEWIEDATDAVGGDATAGVSDLDDRSP